MEGERKGQKHQCVVAKCVPLAGDLACNPGLCSVWESNRDPLVHRPVLNPLSYTSQAIQEGTFVCIVFLNAHLFSIPLISALILIILSFY